MALPVNDTGVCPYNHSRSAFAPNCTANVDHSLNNSSRRWKSDAAVRLLGEAVVSLLLPYPQRLESSAEPA